MKNTQETVQEKLNLQILIPSSTPSIYRDLIKLDTSRSIEVQDFRIQHATFILIVYLFLSLCKPNRNRREIR